MIHSSNTNGSRVLVQPMSTPAEFLPNCLKFIQAPPRKSRKPKGGPCYNSANRESYLKIWCKFSFHSMVNICWLQYFAVHDTSGSSIMMMIDQWSCNKRTRGKLLNHRLPSNVDKFRTHVYLKLHICIYDMAASVYCWTDFTLLDHVYICYALFNMYLRGNVLSKYHVHAQKS